jgi:branched-chain amino acid transport system permease protein
VALALVFVLLAVFPFLDGWPFFESFLSPFRTFQATRFAIWVIILLGLNLLTGYSGQISLGHGALVAVGAYAAGIMMNEGGVPLVLAVPAAGLLGGALGFLLGVPALRLTGPYLAIATLAMMLAFPQILKLNGIRDWTGGAQGILLTTPTVPSSLDGLLSDREWLYFACMVPAVILTVLAWNITRGRVGRALIALRDSEIGAQQMGVNVPLYRMTAFGLSAFYAGIGGALFVYTETFMSPDSFDITLSITMLVVLVLGGLTSVPGTVVAALIMTFRNELVDGLANIGLLDIPGAVFPGQEGSPDTLRGALYGGILVVTIIFMPRGLVGFIEELGGKSPAATVRGLAQLPDRWLGRGRRHPTAPDQSNPGDKA